MKKRSFIVLLALVCGPITGCDNKKDVRQFEAARQAVLNADDPFLELDAFNQTSGDYGRNCDTLVDYLFGTSEKKR